MQEFGLIGAGQWLRYFVGTAELAGAIGLLTPWLAGLASDVMTMSLNQSETQVLGSIADALAGSDPPAGLHADHFSRPAAGEQMPPREKTPARRGRPGTAADSGIAGRSAGSRRRCGARRWWSASTTVRCPGSPPAVPPAVTADAAHLFFAVQMHEPARRAGRIPCRIPPYKRDAGGSNPPAPTQVCAARCPF